MISIVDLTVPEATAAAVAEAEAELEILEDATDEETTIVEDALVDVGLTLDVLVDVAFLVDDVLVVVVARLSK
jgi:hypothetical protein